THPYFVQAGGIKLCFRQTMGCRLFKPMRGNGYIALYAQSLAVYQTQIGFCKWISLFCCFGEPLYCFYEILPNNFAFLKGQGNTGLCFSVTALRLLQQFGPLTNS